MPASLMMKPQKPPSAASRPANGSLVTNLTAYLPAGSTLSTAMKSDLPGDFSKSRSKVNFTSAEVSSWPSWNFTPWRSLKVHVRPSLLTSHDSASSGTGFMSGVEADELVVHHGRAPAARERGHELRVEPGRLGGLGGDEDAAGLGRLGDGAARPRREGAERRGRPP